MAVKLHHKINESINAQDGLKKWLIEGILVILLLLCFSAGMRL
jgi:hypothetical protein